eukprot:m.251557 g.251557  ORF g.251557 m.251557 type:complete len:624 (-) comp19111_c3_seq4:97-1968(-)
MATSVFSKVKRQVKAKAYDADGNEVDFDVREDEEQNVKLGETVELLLAAGYFRARIKGLTPFDKVVGGMTWCITASNEEVDVDLLFQENSTIKQKIALTEKLVAALPRLGCPHRLEPHQIQGLDFVHIYPVVQWLVKKAIETREERSNQIRARAVLVFGKKHQSPEDAQFEALKPVSTATVASVRDTYKPKRQFRAPDKVRRSAQEETRVHSTLLEYGRRYGMSRAPKEENSKKAAVSKSLEGGAEEEDLVAMEEQRVKQLMSQMSETGEGSVSRAAIGSIVGLQSAAIAQLSEEYAAQQASMAADESGRVGGLAAHKRAMASLQKQIEQARKKSEALTAEHESLSQQFAEAQEELNKALTYSRRIDKEMAKLDALEGDESNQVVLAKLRGLVALNESLKQQEAKFKATCKSEMTSYQERIAKLKGEGIEELDVDDERRQAIQQQFAADQKKLQKIRLHAARRNREIAAIQRKVDEIPSRAELTQYQRRFVELYQQIAAKLRETKQYYTLYNTLDDTQLYMNKEIGLLNSIHDNFEKAMASNAGKAQFLQQFEGIVAGITKNKLKVDERLAREKTRRDELSDAYLDLIDKERQYYKTVKDYEAECSKNEVLLAKLKRKASLTA